MTRVPRTFLTILFRGVNIRDNMMTNLSPPTNVVVPSEKNKFDRAALFQQQQLVNDKRWALKKEEGKLLKLYAEKAKANGLEPAYVETNDLIMIIEDLLLTMSPVTKAFKRHEAKESKCKNWATRAITNLDESNLTEALKHLLDNENTSINLMSDFNILDVKSITKSASYSEGLNKLKKQLKITLMLKDKDDQLAVKDKTISDKDIEIKRLNDELLRNKSNDWKSRAIELKKLGVAISVIAKQLGKGRTTVSNYLNLPEVKCLTELKDLTSKQLGV